MSACTFLYNKRKYEHERVQPVRNFLSPFLTCSNVFHDVETDECIIYHLATEDLSLFTPGKGVCYEHVSLHKTYVHGSQEKKRKCAQHTGIFKIDNQFSMAVIKAYRFTVGFHMIC